jgi:mono/diheme cytochrome c family protein
VEQKRFEPGLELSNIKIIQKIYLGRPMIPFKRIHLFLFLFIAIMLSGCDFSLAADVTPPPGYQPPAEARAQAEATSGPLYPLVPPDPVKGQAIFVDKCAPCHGATGQGDGPRSNELPNPIEPIGKPELSHQSSPAAWFKIISQGNMERFMPAFTSLTDRERWDVVAYLYDLSASQESIAQGAALYQANCAKCHGANGDGNGPTAAGKMPDFTSQESMAGKSAAELFQSISTGLPPSMNGYAGSLSEDERWALTDYLRSLTFAASTVAHAAPATSIPGQPTTVSETVPLTATAIVTETAGTGVIQGPVTVESGEPAPAGLAVNIHAFDQMTLVYTATTQLKDDGTYRFDSVQVKKGWSFLATVDYSGIVYGSELTTAAEDGETIEMPIQVYDTTSDATALSVDRLHFFFEFLDQNTVRVVELYVISNPGKKTIVASAPGEPVLKFTLPAGATNLQFQDGQLGGRYVKTDNGFGDTASIQPGAGNYQLLFSYEMPYQRKLDLVRPVTMNTQAVVVLAPEGSVKIKGDGLQDGGTRDVQGVQYHLYNGGSVQAGSEIRLAITGSPAGEAATPVAGRNTNLIIGLGVLGLVLLMAGVWMYLRNRSPEPALQPILQKEKTFDESPENLMDAILALDDLYKDGKLPEEAYLERRAELKQRLKEKMAAQA